MGEEAFLNCYKEHLNKVFESENLDVNIDFMSVSGHKVHGPKGIGFIYVKEK